MEEKSVNLYISITTQFTAIHSWPKCPFEEVGYLRSPHRHVFHVGMKWPVYHDDRDKEFIIMKGGVDKFIRNRWEGRNLGRMSCEQMAVTLMREFDACFVSVFEDGENGAEVYSSGISL